MTEPTSTEAVCVTISGLALEIFGVPTAALVGAAMGSIIAVTATKYENHFRMAIGIVTNITIGIYGGLFAKGFSFFEHVPLPAMCAVCAALGLSLIPIFKTWITKKTEA